MDKARDQMGVAQGKVTDQPNEQNHSTHGHHNEKKQGMMSMEHNHEMEVESKLPPKAWNLIVPIIMLISLSFIMVWLDGRARGDTLLEVFSEANASRDLFHWFFLGFLGFNDADCHTFGRRFRGFNSSVCCCSIFRWDIRRCHITFIGYDRYVLRNC